MNRGSEWRKWDLHIHTPGTAKNDQYGKSDDIWEKYIEALENSDVAVFGITDYFSIRNYKKVCEYQKQGRLDGKYIIPNIEMRLLPVTGRSTLINIHVLFDPQLNVDDIEREFFRPLQFSYGGANYSCIDNDLASLGREVENNQDLNDGVAIQKGIEAFSIHNDTLREIINKDFFKGHIIIALSNSTYDGVSGIIQHEGNLQPLREEITRMADIILSGNPSDIDYFSGCKTSEEDVIASYGSLKPCITGSDAHSLNQIGVFPNDRITWIKADPTFEGLKQILFEPKERVRISDKKPDLKYDYNIIDYVKLNTVGTWNQIIPLNQNLNTIIGGRSTGKSTLLASIAAKFQDIGDKNEENSKFIKGLCDNVHVFWKDGQENENKDIEYFTQNEIANIVSNSNSDNLFQNILIGKEGMRKDYEEYKAKEAELFSSIQAKVSLFFEKRRQYRDKQTFVKTLGDHEGIKREIEKLSKERDSIQLKLTDKKESLEKYLAIEKELTQLHAKATVLKRDKELLAALCDSLFLQISQTIAYTDLSEENNRIITERLQCILSNSNSNMQDFVKSLITDIEKEYNDVVRDISEKQNEDSYKDGKKIFNENKNLSYIVNQITSLSKQLDSINREIKLLDELNKEYKRIALELMDEHLSYLDMMNSIANRLSIQHDNITLSANYELSSELEENLLESVSLRSAAMNELIANVVEQYKTKTKDKVRECLKTILNKALSSELSLKNGFIPQSFISMILSNNWYELKYNVDYEGDKLTRVSS